MRNIRKTHRAIAVGCMVMLGFAAAGLAQEAPAAAATPAPAIDGPALRADVARIDRLEQRVRLPLLTRRYAAPTAQERAETAGMDSIAILETLAASRGELSATLTKAGEAVPPAPVATPPPDVVSPGDDAGDELVYSWSASLGEPRVVSPR